MDHWTQVEELFHATLEQPVATRAAYLTVACAGNEPLRAEVQGLLDRVDSQDGFLEGSPLDGHTSPADRWSPGKMVGRFEILELVGTGGMGDVYRARDTRLDRTVAVKVCRERFTERFEREARAIAALTHPHICTLYDVGPNYLVMEYLEGKPFTGPLALAQALDYAVQAAGALEAAHSRGVVHRDLKPANILVTKAGVKLVDFGLAKFASGGAADDLTKESNVPGTLRYMAPEQLDGKPADARSDIYSLGLVLYEAITGAPAFAAGSPASLVASILREVPAPLSSRHPGIPAELDRVIAKCLAKDPDARWRTAADLRDELRWIAQPKPAPEAKAPARWLWPAALVALMALGGGWFFGRPTAAATPVVVLMDTTAPDGVYDADTRARSGTNADDLSDALQDLPIELHKEMVGVGWNREEQLLKQRPRLILIHRSAFVHALAAEFTPDPAATTPLPNPASDKLFYRRLSGLGRDKFESILGYVGRTNAQTTFVIYSRDWSPASQRGWVDAVLRRFPHLNGRLTPFNVGPEDAGASFRQPDTVKQIRQKVTAALAAR